MRQNTFRFEWSVRIGVIFLAGLLAGMPLAWAVYGQAEEFDEFTQEDLDQFQEFLMRDEAANQTASEMLQQEGTAIDRLTPEELELLKQELLVIPKKDLISGGITGEYQYDTNIKRLTGQTKGDSIFDTRANVQVDLSGRKTTLQAETFGGKQWNWVYSEKDYYEIGERFRYRRKYFKKLQHALQINVLRNNTRTVELDDRKIRWDVNVRNTLNHELTRKFSWNTDWSFTKRLYTTEAFDQDSQWEVGMAPSVFWSVTPKSRLSLGYQFGASRIRTKAGDSNSHSINLGYFGQVTKKSSTSASLSYVHQDPRSKDTSTVDTVTIGLGYIWQATPKLQSSIQLFRSMQNTSSDLVADTTNEVTKQDVEYTNNSLTLALNSRINRKLAATLSFTASYVKTETEKGNVLDRQDQEFRFPTSLGLRYDPYRWLRFTLDYTFDTRQGPKDQDDAYIDQIFKSTCDVIF
ncbi:MAG: hypothetical protein ACOY3K_06440 [Candidatus Omnitrophota bacterium]